MLARREITTGTCYVNDEDKLLREALQVRHNRVICNVYDLATGKLHGAPQVEIGKAEFIRWANREATDEESSRLQREEAQGLYRHRHEIEQDLFANAGRRSAEAGQAGVRLISR